MSSLRAIAILPAGRQGVFFVLTLRCVLAGWIIVLSLSAQILRSLRSLRMTYRMDLSSHIGATYNTLTLKFPNKLRLRFFACGFG